MVARENIEHNSLFSNEPHSVWLSTHKGEVQVRILTTPAKFQEAVIQNSNRLFVGYLLLLVKNPRWFKSIASRDLVNGGQFPTAPFVAIWNDSFCKCSTRRSENRSCEVVEPIRRVFLKSQTSGGLHVFAKRTGNKGQPRTSVNGVSNKFKRMAELYRYFARHWEGLDFSDDALLEMFNSESYGTPVRPKNGYLVGKGYLNMTVTAWKEDIALGSLFVKELYHDGNFPEWWLDGIFRDSPGYGDR